MIKRNAVCSIAGLLLVLSLPAALTGCGPAEHQSEEDFLNAVRGTENVGDEADGTVPPVDRPMDEVAKARVETNDLDLGLVPNDRISHHKLKVYNDGKMPLKITKIDTTCACTMGHITPENATVQPGQESWIDVTLDPNRVMGFKSHKTLTITTSDPAQGQIAVDVRARIEPEFALDIDEELALGDFAKGDRIERRIRFRQVQEGPVTVLGVEPISTGARAAKIAGLDIRVDEIPEAEWQTAGKREYDIVIATTPEITAGAFERTLVMRTDVPRLQRFPIYVVGTALAPYTTNPVYPQRAVLQPEAGAEGFVARVNFGSAGEISLAPGAPSNPAITATAVQGASPAEWVLELRIPLSGLEAHKAFDETVPVQVTAEGKTYTEIVGVQYSAAGHSPDDGHDH